MYGILLIFPQSRQLMPTLPCLSRILQLTPGTIGDRQDLQNRASLGIGVLVLIPMRRAIWMYLLPLSRSPAAASRHARVCKVLIRVSAISFILLLEIFRLPICTPPFSIHIFDIYLSWIHRRLWPRAGKDLRG